MSHHHYKRFSILLLFCVGVVCAYADIQLLQKTQPLNILSNAKSQPVKVQYGVWTYQFDNDEQSTQRHQAKVHTAVVGEQPVDTWSNPGTAIYRTLVNWENPSSLTPYVGAGIGSAHADADGLIQADSTGIPLRARGSETLYQFVTGTVWEISPAWEMELVYRHSTTNETLREEASREASIGEKIEKLSKQSGVIQVGVTFKF